MIKQIAAMVFNGVSFMIWRKTGSRKCIAIDMTPAQHAEISLTYSIMRSALKEQIDMTVKAFKNYRA